MRERAAPLFRRHRPSWTAPVELLSFGLYFLCAVLLVLSRIGHDAVVGSSVWLTRSVTPNATVVMETPRLKMRSDAEAVIAEAGGEAAGAAGAAQQVHHIRARRPDRRHEPEDHDREQPGNRRERHHVRIDADLVEAWQVLRPEHRQHAHAHPREQQPTGHGGETEQQVRLRLQQPRQSPIPLLHHLHRHQCSRCQRCRGCRKRPAPCPRRRSPTSICAVLVRIAARIT